MEQLKELPFHNDFIENSTNSFYSQSRDPSLLLMTKTFNNVKYFDIYIHIICVYGSLKIRLSCLVAHVI